MAAARQLPVRQPEKLAPDERVWLAAQQADVALVMAYGQILKDDFIATPRLGTLNLHASILPKHRGASPVQTAIACGDPETGVTLMRVVRKLDAGPVADVERVPIAPLETAAEVERKLAAACVPLLARTLPRLRAGTLEFSVAGHALPHLRLPLSVIHHYPVELSIMRTTSSPAQPGPAQSSVGLITVMLSRTGEWVMDGVMSAYANGSSPGPMEPVYTMPGSYWVHTSIGLKGLCESSFTAGGVNLAREPAILGLTGSAAPMELTLRDDCAKLTLSLPQSLATPAAGEEPFYTVYVIPEFDSTGDVQPSTLRTSTGGSVTLENLTPGSYRVYTFNGPARLEYRNPAALAALPNPGQQVTLSPGSTSNLVLEVSGP